MSDRGILVFAYDGSMDGFYSAVFDAFKMRFLPTDIIIESDMEPTLLKIHRVETDRAHANRVRAGIAAKISPMTLGMVEKALLFDGEGKENMIMRFIWEAFDWGPKAGRAIADKVANPVFRMCVAVNNEAERFRQFTRFTDYNGALVAEIHPKHFVLPLIRSFFCNRIKNEHFMIYDSEHGAALIHSPGKTAIVPVESLELPKDTEDKFYSELWKSYYRHIAIGDRYNPTCRRTHMPKRFWQYLPEVEGELAPDYVPKLTFGTSKEIGDGLRREMGKLNARNECRGEQYSPVG